MRFVCGGWLGWVVFEMIEVFFVKAPLCLIIGDCRWAGLIDSTAKLLDQPYGQRAALSALLSQL